MNDHTQARELERRLDSGEITMRDLAAMTTAQRSALLAPLSRARHLAIEQALIQLRQWEGNP